MFWFNMYSYKCIWRRGRSFLSIHIWGGGSSKTESEFKIAGFESLNQIESISYIYIYGLLLVTAFEWKIITPPHTHTLYTLSLLRHRVDSKEKPNSLQGVQPVPTVIVTVRACMLECAHTRWASPPKMPTSPERPSKFSSHACSCGVSWLVRLLFSGSR